MSFAHLHFLLLFTVGVCAPRGALSEVVDGKVYESPHRGMACPAGQAETPSGCAKIQYSKKTVIHFEDELEVDGTLQKPGLEYIVSKPKLAPFRCDVRTLSESELEECVTSQPDFKPAPECPTGMAWIAGKCREPEQTLKTLLLHPYDAPVKIPTLDLPKTLPPAVQAHTQVLRDAYDRTQECPTQLADAQLLRLAVRELKANKRLPPVSVRLLSRSPTPHRACGINTTFRAQFDESIYCPNENTCFDPGRNAQGALIAECARFERESAQSSVFIEKGTTCNGAKSYRDGGAEGDLYLGYLGRGVYIHVYQNPKREFYFGLVFVSKSRTQNWTTLTPDDLKKSDRYIAQSIERWITSLNANHLTLAQKQRLEALITQVKKRASPQ